MAEQVRCPSCGGGQALQESDQYECQFCLTAFTFRHAQDEQARVLEEIKAWVDQRVGRGAEGSGDGIDASSRAYLFRRNLLPALQTSFDRALETTLGFEQHPLLPAPDGNGQSGSANPLLVRREEVLRLSDLRARLESADVRTFAVTEDDQAKIAGLDGRLQEILALSNTAHAAAQGTAQGFAAARNNLEAVLAAGTAHPGIADRYRALADLSRVMERAVETTSLSGAGLASEAEEIAERLEEVATRLEGDTSSTVGASLAAVAARAEAGHARALARWLRSYDAIVRRPGLPFPTFVGDTVALLGAAKEAQAVADIVEACALAFQAVRGEVPVRAIESYGWVQSVAKDLRRGRWLSMIGLGFLGKSEEVDRSEEFFHPFWLFRAGGTTWLVDACGVSEAPVFSSAQREWADLEGPLERPVAVRRPRPFPMPTVTAAEAERRVRAQLRATGSHNAEISGPDLALLPAAGIHLETRKGARRVEAHCLEGRIRLKSSMTLQRLAIARRVQERFQ